MNPKQSSPLRLALWLAVALALGGSMLWLARPQAEGRVVASITVGEETVRTIDLTKAKDQEFSILEETGKPITFQIKDHAIRFLESDCPDKVCINTGFLKNDLDVACCLPNQTALLVSKED